MTDWSELARQAEADRLLAMTQQQQAVQEATEQLAARLTREHQREFEQLRATSKVASAYFRL